MSFKLSKQEEKIFNIFQALKDVGISKERIVFDISNDLNLTFEEVNAYLNNLQQKGYL